MHPSLTTTYLRPAILLNPVLFLHSLNTILSRLLPPIVAATQVQPAPYSNLGPSANHPHLDMHASDNLCWSYTAVMVCAQLVAFGSVSQSREERRERRERKREKEDRRMEERRLDQMKAGVGASKEVNGVCRLGNGDTMHTYGTNGTIDENRKATSFTRDDSEGTEDEIIL
jgi:hypothetical protein